MATPTGPQWGANYTLTSAAGAIAVFNNEASGNFVGILDPEQSSGLDSADVRESAADRVEADGGIHGNFFLGRRPVMLGGIIRATTVTQRNERIAALKLASLALRTNAVLEWTVTGGVATFITVRRQQPVRFVGKGFVKAFQVPLIAADPRIYSMELHESSFANATKGESKTITNAGDFNSPPTVIRITGPGTDFTVEINGKPIVLKTTIAAGHFVDLNPDAATALLDGVTSVYDKIERPTTQWTFLEPGSNTFKWNVTSGNTAATKVEVKFRDAWQ